MFLLGVVGIFSSGKGIDVPPTNIPPPLGFHAGVIVMQYFREIRGYFVFIPPPLPIPPVPSAFFVFFCLRAAVFADRVQHAEYLQPPAEPERGRACPVHAGEDERHASRHLCIRVDPIGGCLARPREQQGVGV